MKTKKILLGALAAVLTVLISIAATVAYLTDVDSETNVFTIGNVDIDLLEYERVDTETFDEEAIVKAFDDSEEDRNPLLPAVIENGFDYTAGDTYVGWTQIGKDGYQSDIWDPAKINNEVDKMVFVKNTGDYDAYVRLYFAFEAGSFETFDKFQKMIHLNLNADGGWKWEWLPFPAENADGDIYFIAKATYKEALAPDNFTDITLSQIALDPTATNEHVSAFGDTYEVCVNTQAIQSAGFTDPDAALDEGFGEDIPFADLTLVTGIDLKTALHNLNGNDSTPITDKVTSVTFGLNKDHSDKVSGYEGTLTSVEQDVPVYTYYVPNATNSANYDVYVLADSAIYTPNDSTALFKDMTALTKVDTANVDVSRTEIMAEMFRGCAKLTDIDTSKWNTENVTTITRIFQNCSSLENVDVSNWKTEKVTSFRTAFSGCSSLTTLDIDEWNTSNVTDMAFMFWHCFGLTKLNVSDWKVDNVENMKGMFEECSKLSVLDVSSWNVGRVTNADHLFYNCSTLSALDVGSWNVGSVTNMSYMFAGCTGLETLAVSEWDVSNVVDFHWFVACTTVAKPMKINSLDVSKWNTGSATNMSCMFYNCQELKSLDVSKWNVSNVTTMANMFEYCIALETLNVSNWNVEKLKNSQTLFRNCRSLTTLDLGFWKTESLTVTVNMFDGCSGLTTIYVGDDWDMSNVTDSANMFTGCTSIKGESGTVYDAANANDVTYANTETGYLTHISDKPATPEA